MLTNYVILIWDALLQPSAGHKVCHLVWFLFFLIIPPIFPISPTLFVILLIYRVILMQKSGRPQLGDGQQGERPPECKQQ